MEGERVFSFFRPSVLSFKDIIIFIPLLVYGVVFTVWSESQTWVLLLTSLLKYQVDINQLETSQHTTETCTNTMDSSSSFLVSFVIFYVNRWIIECGNVQWTKTQIPSLDYWPIRSSTLHRIIPTHSSTPSWLVAKAIWPVLFSQRNATQISHLIGWWKIRNAHLSRIVVTFIICLWKRSRKMWNLQRSALFQESMTLAFTLINER